MEVPIPSVPDPSIPSTLKIADTGTRDLAKATEMRFKIDGKGYAVSFWPDDVWGGMPEDRRPAAHRSSSDDGWFNLSPFD
jgi:hypothetical protein